MVVRVEPLLHLLSREVDSITLASTTHGEVAVEGGDVGLRILGGDDLGRGEDSELEKRNGSVVQLTLKVLEKSRTWS